MPQILVKKLEEGPSRVLIRVDLFNNDGSGELVNQVIFSGTDCKPAIPVLGPPSPVFRIMQVWYGMVWFDVTMGMGTLQPEDCWTLTRDSAVHVDFTYLGGLVDPAYYDNPAGNPPSDDNGRLWISTNGFNTVGSRGSLIIELKKLGLNNP